MKPVCALSVLIFCWFGINGCTGSGAMKTTQASADKPASTFTITGTVVYLNLEGGVYVIRGDDGQSYNPSNLPEKYQKDGLSVTAVARTQTDAMGIHMVGPIIEIVDISAR